MAAKQSRAIDWSMLRYSSQFALDISRGVGSVGLKILYRTGMSTNNKIVMTVAQMMTAAIRSGSR